MPPRIHVRNALLLATSSPSVPFPLPGYLKFASQESQDCLKKTSRMPHRILIEFVEFMEFMGFVGLKRQSAVEKR